MFQLKRMSTCSLETVLDAWNRGFEGYAVDLALTLDRLLSRIAADGISLEKSIVVFSGDEPVGFLMNAFRESDGRKFAWNGGTGVVPELRGQGVGRILMNAALELYQKESVNVALLEALSDNHSAIGLYKKYGYEILEDLTLLQIAEARVSFAISGNYCVERVDLPAVGKLHFYRELSPWQCQWQNLLRAQGEACIVYDQKLCPVAYALFKKIFDAGGTLKTILLYQCEVVPEHDEAQDIAAHALQKVFGVPTGIRRSTHDFRKSNEVVVDLLTTAGFTTFVEQVHMVKTITS